MPEVFLIELSVAEIRKGDVFSVKDIHVWTAVEDAEPSRDPTARDGEIQVRVRHVDGGTSVRVWDDDSYRLQVERTVE